MSKPKETDADHISTASTSSSLKEPETTSKVTSSQFDRSSNDDATRDDSSTDATDSDMETNKAEYELHSSTVSLAEEFDFEVVGHGGDFKWAQGQRKKLINIEKSHPDGIENKTGLNDKEMTSPYDSCSSTPASLPSSPMVQKKDQKKEKVTVPPEVKVSVASIPTRRMGDKDPKIGKARPVQGLAAQKQNWIESILETGLDQLEACLESIGEFVITDKGQLIIIKWLVLVLCGLSIGLGAFILLKDQLKQQIIVDQDFPVPTGIFLLNADTRHIPAIYSLLEGWDEPNDNVYRFQISATDSDGKPRRQGLDHVTAVITLTPLSFKRENSKNMPIILRARGDADGIYTFAVSDPESGVGPIVVDIYAATHAQIEKAGLQNGAGVGYRIEGSPFVIRGKFVNEKEQGKDPSQLVDETEKSPPERDCVFTVAWQYVQNVLPNVQVLDSQIRACVSEPILDATERVQTGVQMLNNLVFENVVTAKENVATFVKDAVETLQELVSGDVSEKEEESGKTKIVGESKAFATNIRKHVRDRIIQDYGHVKAKFKQLVSKIPFPTFSQDAKRQTEPILQKAQTEIQKFGSYIETKRKQIIETTSVQTTEFCKNVEKSVQTGWAVTEKWARASVLAFRRKSDQIIAEKESTWMNFRRALSKLLTGQ